MAGPRTRRTAGRTRSSPWGRPAAGGAAGRHRGCPAASCACWRASDARRCGGGRQDPIPSGRPARIRRGCSGRRAGAGGADIRERLIKLNTSHI